MQFLSFRRRQETLDSKTTRRRRRSVKRRQAFFERLEDRLLLAQVFWNVDANGFWDVAANWRDECLPGGL